MLSVCFPCIPTLLGAGERILTPQSSSSTAVPAIDAQVFGVVDTPAGLEIKFSDKSNSDNYIHIDLGRADIEDFIEGGYVEVEADIDLPILRLCPVIADPSRFWDSRQIVEGGTIMKTGNHSYRFYLDGISPEIAKKTPNSHLYLFLQDLGGDDKGKAIVRIRWIALFPTKPGWEKDKCSFYKEQYHWPETQKIEPLYYEDFSRAQSWAQIQSALHLKLREFTGGWKKHYFGDNTWDYSFLKNATFADPGYDDANWETASVPEAEIPNQNGGYYWYRIQFQISENKQNNRYFLRLDDVADDALIYLNGKLVGSQASSQKRLDWIVQGGERSLKGIERNASEMVQWHFFERCGIPFPFDANAVPKQQQRLILPIHTGSYAWPYAYDVTSLINQGENTLAIRVYGNPVKSWWIFRHPYGRTARNIFGLLGKVMLAQIDNPAIASVGRTPPKTVDDDGLALHILSCNLINPAKIKEVRFLCNDEVRTINVDGVRSSVRAEFLLPARFVNYNATVSVFGSNGELADQRSVEFHGAVTDIENQQLRVNGEPFFVRGINANPGLELENDNRQTREEFLRLLRFYQQMGFNTIRLEGGDTWQMEEAFHHGMMVVPLAAAGSCNLSITSLGDLVDPDFRLATDRHRAMAAILSNQANILVWNGGNEIFHTPGYIDKPVLNNYLNLAREAFQSIDPDKRMTTYSNLDSFAINWFFFEGQDIVGWNIYGKSSVFEDQFKTISQLAGERPILFTEWGTKNGKKDREGNLDNWEDEIRKKWRLISEEKQSAGGIFYAFHGEMEDARGRKFMQELILPFEIERTDETLVIKNRDRASMRQVSILSIKDDNIGKSELVPEIKPGQSVSFSWPKTPGEHLEIRYDTHRGLKHFYTTANEPASDGSKSAQPVK